MGLHKQYMRVGQSAKNSLFGISPNTKSRTRPTTLHMLISHRGKFNHGRLSLILFGIFTLVLGIILSSIPWLDYIILKNLRLWNGSLSFQYWQKPGVIRLTKIYIFNISNNDSFLNYGEKPKFTEVGPFVYREDMEKVNIKFHENHTVSYQHKKILKFVPELSVNPDAKVIIPNIPLLSLTTLSNHLGFFVQKAISAVVSMSKYKPFVSVTVDDLVFGYDDTLVALAHRFYPRNKRPPSKMGLLTGRNGTLKEVHNLFTGQDSMENFGYLNRLNGLDNLPYWKRKPCNSIRGSEGSFFPPDDIANKKTVYVYDKDVCRILPMEYERTVEKNGITAYLYKMSNNTYDPTAEENKCFYNGDEEDVPMGLQYIGPCQSDAPIYMSNPHFMGADPSLSDAVEGMKPDASKHSTYLKLQPKLGVPLEVQVRAQMNIKVERARNIEVVKNFPSIVYPIIWVEEGVAEVTPEIRRWMYLATTVSDISGPLLAYGLIVLGTLILTTIFIKAYKNLVFTKKTIEIGMKTIRRSSFIVNGQHRLMIVRDSYTLLQTGEESLSV